MKKRKTMSKIVYSAIQYGLLTIDEHSPERAFPILRSQANIYHIAPPALLVATRSFFTSSAVVYFCQDFFVCVPVTVMSGSIPSSSSSSSSSSLPSKKDSVSFSKECFCIRYSPQCPVTFFFFNNPDTTQYCSKLHLVLVDDDNVRHRNRSEILSPFELLPSQQESLQRFAFFDNFFTYSSFYMQQIKITFLFHPLKEGQCDSETERIFANAFMNDNEGASFSADDGTPYQRDEYSKADGTILNAIFFKRSTENNNSNNKSSNMASRFLNLASLSLVEFSTYTFDVFLSLHHQSQQNSRNETSVFNYSIRNLTFNLRCRNDHMFLISDYLFPPYRNDDDSNHEHSSASSFYDWCDVETGLGFTLCHTAMVSCERGNFFNSLNNSVPREAFKFVKTNSFSNFIKFMTNGARSLEALTIESSSLTVRDDSPIVFSTNSANRRNELEVGFVELNKDDYSNNGIAALNNKTIFSLHHMLIDSLYLSNPLTSSYSSRRLKLLDLSRLRLALPENRSLRDRDAREFSEVLEIVQNESKELRGISSADASVLPNDDDDDDDDDEIALMNRILVSQEFFHDLIYEACPQLEVLKLPPEINGRVWTRSASKDSSFIANMSGFPLQVQNSQQQQPTTTAMLLQSLNRIVLRDLASFKICVTTFMKGIRKLSITCPLTRTDIIVMGTNMSLLEAFNWEQDIVGFSLMEREFFTNGGSDNNNNGQTFFDLDFSPPSSNNCSWFDNLTKLVLSSVAGPASPNLAVNRMQVVGNKTLLHLMTSVKKLKNISLSEFVYENNPMKGGSFDDEVGVFARSSSPATVKKIVTLQLEYIFVPVKRLDAFFSEIFSLGRFGLKNLFMSLIFLIIPTNNDDDNNNDGEIKFPSLTEVCSMMVANYSYMFDDSSRPQFEKFHFVCAAGRPEPRKGYKNPNTILTTKDGNEFPLMKNNNDNKKADGKNDIVDPMNCKPLFREEMEFFEIGCFFNGIFCHGRK